jgi:hypothetical protein
MRSITKQDIIRRARLKLIKIATFQNKALTSERSEMRDRKLSTKTKLKEGQMQDRAHEDLI